MSDVYQYIAASICKAVQTQYLPQTAGRTRAAYDEAVTGMTRDANREYMIEAKNENGIWFRYGEFKGTENVMFGSWHELPSEHTNRVFAYLHPGQTTRGISVRYQELDQFL